VARILVIEDNASNAKLAVFLLARAGHEVRSVPDAEEGLRLAQAELPDLVIMDVQLPGIDGLEATRRLRADPATRALKVLALTAFAMKGDEQKIIDAGCDDYLAKPYQYNDLLQRVEALLAKEA
jgi:two-component system cell cycle response regulator DivK